MSQNRLKLMKRFANDMLFFGKTLRPKVFEVRSPNFHKKICAYLKREKYQFLNVIAPRGFAKTTLVGFVYILWHIFVEDFANGRKRRPKFVVVVSKSRSHSINILTSIKNALEYSINLKRVFGYYGEHTAIQWREDKVILKDGTIIDCRGMGQQVRGMNIDNRRPTLIVLDDGEDEENTKTDESINNNRNWFLRALMPMIKKTKPAGRIVNIGTPQHQAGLVFTLKEMKTWQTLHFSAIYKDGAGKRRSLWPEMWTLAELDEKKEELEEIGRVSAFYREYMCQVVGDEDALVTRKDLRFWKGRLKKDKATGRPILHVTHRGNAPGVALEEPEKVPVFLFMGVDPASTLSARSDFSVIFVIAVDADRNKYCLYYKRKRMKPMQLAASIIECYEEYVPERTRIESVGYQEMIRDYLRTEYEGYIPGIEIKHNPRSSKSHRLESLQPAFARGKVFIREGMDEFTDELLLYPRAKHDDTLDGFYYAQLNVYGPTAHKTVTERRRTENELRHFISSKEYNRAGEDWLLA